MSKQTVVDIGKYLNIIAGYLQHCSETKNLVATRKLHSHLLTTGLLSVSPHLHAKLILTYKPSIKTCTNPQTFLTSFFQCMNLRESSYFNTLVSEFSHSGYPYFALKTVSFMHANAVPIDTYALCSSLTTSSLVKNVKFGTQIHSFVEKSGWLPSIFVGSALIHVYSKTSLVDHAHKMFDQMPLRNTICANALISGYGEAKMWVEGLKVVRKMPTLGLSYDHFTLSAILRACAGLSAVELGRQAHSYLIRTIYSLRSDAFLQSSLIEMYGKCGMVKKARQVFDLKGLEQKDIMRNRDVVLWTSMLGVYGRNGYYKEVIELFKEMLIEGIRPDGVAFLTVLSACRHTGQVKLGVNFFKAMRSEFELQPGSEHYSCLVDLLCRAGELEKAWVMVNQMDLIKGDRSGSSSTTTVSMLGSFLSACIEYGNVELGKLAAVRIIELGFDQIVGISVMLSNFYARFAMWNEIEGLRELIRKRGLKKNVGCSWVEVTR